MATSRRTRKRVVFLSSLALLFIVLGIWSSTYGEGDPKNIRYVLWKVGLYKMDLDIAADTMIGDAHRDKLVIGKTKSELREKFGYLLTLSETSQYNRGCYESEGWKGSDVLFIRTSAWMLVFDGDKVKTLVLIKGC